MAPASRIVAAALALAGVLSAWAAPAALAASSAPPARGAPVGDVLIASAVGTLLTVVLLWIATAHRSGRIRWLARAAGAAERATGLPGWASLPMLLTTTSMGVAVVGFYWDVAVHIDAGRDSGPFGTVAHYPILAGLGGIAVGGLLAMVLGADARVPSAVRLTRTWSVPVGGLLIFLCGAFALLGFPLDDVWHTLFGQDVTLWGPTHVLMIGGASLSVLGMWILRVEGERAREVSLEPSGARAGAASASAAPAAAAPAAAPRSSAWLRVTRWSVGGAFLIGMSTLQGEFDYGIPQFQLVYHPILLMLAAGVALVAARIWIGRGGALAAAVFNVVVFGALSLYIGPALGLSTLHFPLYIAEALLVELVALRIGRERPIALGLASGALIGTVGLAAEWGWSHVWMPIPWPSSLLPEAAILGFAAALAGGVLGGWIGRALTDRPGRRAGAAGLAGDGQAGAPAQSATAAPSDVPSAGTAGSPLTRWAPALAGVVAIACIAYPLPMTAGRTMTVSATLATIDPPPARTVSATFHITPRDAADGAQWVQVTDWQGGGLVVDRLRRVAPGVYRTTQPIPVGGNWKAALRIAHGRDLMAAPISLPADPAIPAAAVPAREHFTRAFVRDKQIFQREAIGGSLWLTTPAYLILLAIVGGWLAAMIWGLRRLREPPADAGRATVRGTRRRPPAQPSRRPATTPSA